MAPLVTDSLLFLGTGTSHGIPVIGCQCDVCCSSNPKNNRMRTSALLKLGSQNILLDPCVDFRQQALRFGIDHVDAVLVTHPHADHIFGLDELRIFSQRTKTPIPVYGSASTIEELKLTFRYVFAPPQMGGGVPQLDLRVVEDCFDVCGLPFQTVPIKHGVLDIEGYRVGNLAYLTDCSEIPQSSWRLLQGLHTLVLGALRFRPHPTHFNLEQALQVVGRLKPKHAFFVHICHDMEHEQVSKELPAGVSLAFDGLETSLDTEEANDPGD